jgi:hypothetical protein
MKMKQMKQWLMVVAVVALCGMMTGCKGNAQRHVNGTMEEAVALGEAPQAVVDLMKHVNIDDRYEMLMEENLTGVSVKVWSLLKCSDEVSSEGYGIVVGKGDVKTALPEIRHGRMPRARYDTSTTELWIVGSDMEGTGVDVERLYELLFDGDGYASIMASIDPYEMQQALCKALTYSINGQEITFYAEGKELAKATNTMEDMGGFMEDAIYIGEQIAYGIEGPLTVQVTPGVNFVVGKVLHYDDMPTIGATVTLNDDGSIALSDFKAMP